MAPDAIDGFLERLAAGGSGPNSVNPFDRSRGDNAVRRRNLTRYLEQLSERRPATLLVGEAPGYRGMAITGVPFTNTVPSRANSGMPRCRSTVFVNGTPVIAMPR